ncbi:MAG TPA: methylated-DNA--[protein]-cysteine S-methyltransferase [Humidesulfovibrio sp.]|uniref:methylated-DNA--[protein]-cysteine S-methyltransferase n=1 Tax=Humidesulfovibrio sp. TaxID=2910988 RepID=UPI002CA76C0C|nr:methylated-DNA--[protein]-cysteine S-methyltransferase [Humidesulfovibrio sp.]HWR03035.1 methylated-DNA--[protein]-cysteine S-methyltransferase [Humidesulfovibrio sp.]
MNTRSTHSARAEAVSEPAARRIIEAACRSLENDEPAPGLAQLAEAAGLSRWHFQRLFKRRLGVTPKQYLNALRAQRLKASLQPGGSITDAVYAAGFGSPSRVYESARRMLGMSPGAYRDGGQGLRIRRAVAQSRLGLLLVAATEAGICAIEFGEEEGELLERLARRFPRAASLEPDEVLRGYVERIVAAVEAGAELSGLPLDIRGTAFQHTVWRALQNIPAGGTRTYSELAEAIGRPGAARAVARACASNPLAVAVPCHRAVGKDGGLTGYRWGLERKKALLEREASRAAEGSEKEG